MDQAKNGAKDQDTQTTVNQSMFLPTYGVPSPLSNSSILLSFWTMPFKVGATSVDKRSTTRYGGRISWMLFSSREVPLPHTSKSCPIDPGFSRYFSVAMTLAGFSDVMQEGQNHQIWEISSAGPSTPWITACTTFRSRGSRTPWTYRPCGRGPVLHPDADASRC